MTKCVFLCFLLISAQFTYAADRVKTRFGEVQINELAEDSWGLTVGSKLIFKRAYGHLDIEKVFQSGATDVALIANNEGGSASVNKYFLVTLSDNSEPVISKTMSPVDGVIKATQNGNQISFDLGFKHGTHQVSVYQNGTLINNINRGNVKGEIGNEEYCQFLYKNILTEYVKRAECDGEPETIYGEATAKGFRIVSNDPHFKIGAFREIAEKSCEKHSILKYGEFKRNVCNG